MRTIKINLYSFNELSEEAKQKAVKNNAATHEYFWAYDAIKSLRAFINHFEAKLKNYSIDFYSASYSYIELNSVYNASDFESEEEYLNFIDEKLFELGSYNKETYKGNGECKLTGVCFDECLIDGFRISYLKEGERDLKQLLNNGFNEWLAACKKDYEYQISSEGFSDYCESNELEFLETGEIY